jgi:hypothetical protein
VAWLGKRLAAEQHDISSASGVQHNLRAGLEDHELGFAECSWLSGGLDFSGQHESALDVLGWDRESRVRLQHYIDIHQLGMHRHGRALIEGFSSNISDRRELLSPSRRQLHAFHFLRHA